jgi:hypothetical protein
MKLIHGSAIQGLSILEPHKETAPHGQLESRVWMCTDVALAALFAVRWSSYKHQANFHFYQAERCASLDPAIPPPKLHFVIFQPEVVRDCALSIYTLHDGPEEGLSARGIFKSEFNEPHDFYFSREPLPVTEEARSPSAFAFALQNSVYISYRPEGNHFRCGRKE